MMTDDNILKELHDMHYTGEVDVVDSVMEQVRKRPYLMSPAHPWRTVRRVVASVAACAALIAIINVTNVFVSDYNEPQMSALMAEVYDFHADYGNFSEDSYDMGAVEYFYSDDADM